MAEQVRFFTRALAVPKLIGRTPDGKQIPFGPYTLTQFIGAGAVGLVMWQTSGLWAQGGFVQNAIVLTAVVLGTVYGLGKVPATGRNPLSLLAGFAHAVSAGARPAKVDGRVVRNRRPEPFIGEVVILDAPRDLDIAPPIRRPAPTPVPSRVVAPPRAAMQLASLAAARK